MLSGALVTAYAVLLRYTNCLIIIIIIIIIMFLLSPIGKTSTGFRLPFQFSFVVADRLVDQFVISDRLVDLYHRRRSIHRPIASSTIVSSTSFVVAGRLVDQFPRRRSTRRQILVVADELVDQVHRRRSTRRPGSSSSINSSARFVVADQVVDEVRRRRSLVVQFLRR